MFTNVSRCLGDYLSNEYKEALIKAADAMMDIDSAEAGELLNKKIDYFPEQFKRRLSSKLALVGKPVIPPIRCTVKGCGTNSFEAVTNTENSPLSAVGSFRLAEDGKVHYAAKSEHYHIPLGHSFPGYALIENAKKLGITNATHNNTRGNITRRLERELVRVVNGIAKGNDGLVDGIIGKNEPQLLNRVINLNTGSLAGEAGFKMMLSKFYRVEAANAKPANAGYTPVILVMGDFDGGSQANYHGTAVTTQMSRGLWPELCEKLDAAGAVKYVPVGINDFEDFKNKFEKYNKGSYRIAGFSHEPVLMNFSAIRLYSDYLKSCYSLCHEHKVPVMVDEVQSGAWYPELFLFKRYGLDPDIVVIGKGFPGGLYSSSKIITTGEYDTLTQFGALITNGQEELSSLAYLITMDFIEENAAALEEMGKYIADKLNAFAAKHSDHIVKIEGDRHLAGIVFGSTEKAIAFCSYLNEKCIDISAQTYKANCPPAALLKLPVIADKAEVDMLLGLFELAIDTL